MSIMDILKFTKDKNIGYVDDGVAFHKSSLNSVVNGLDSDDLFVPIAADIENEENIGTPGVNDAAADGEPAGDYVYTGSIGEHTYELYVKKCVPEVRDALLFLNLLADLKTTGFLRKCSTELEVALEKASCRLRDYVYSSWGVLRLLFTKVTESHALTSCILYDVIAAQNITEHDVFDRINTLTDRDIFAHIVSCASINSLVTHNVAEYVCSDMGKFYYFMNGAEYSDSMRKDIINMYETYQIADPKKSTLKKELVKFLTSYFEVYKGQFESMRPYFEKERNSMISEIKSRHKLDGITDNYVFRRIATGGAGRQTVSIEPLAFCSGHAEYYGKYNNFVICIGYGYRDLFEDSSDVNRIGDKFKYFAYSEALDVLNVLRERPCTVDEITETLKLSKTTVYRLIKKFAAQKLILKEQGSRYAINKEMFMSLIKTLEIYGGKFNG